MNIRHYLSSLRKVLFGYTSNSDLKTAPYESDVERAWQRYQAEIRTGATMNHPLGEPGNLLIVVIHAELMYGNYKSSQMLRIAIERFDRSSTVLSRRMLMLTMITCVLVVVQIFIAILN